MHRSLFLLAALALAPPALANDGPAADAGAIEAPVERAAPSHPLDDLLGPLTETDIFTDASVGLQVVDLATGEEVFAHRADEGMVPASTMKVLTAAAALDQLGPSYRFRTDLVTDGKLGGDGVLDGNLYVVGGGDPTMVVETLWKLVYDLRLEGVRQVTGNVYFDDSRFDHEWRTAGWDKQADIDNGPSYFASVGALSLNFNTIAVVVGPGAEAGAKARAELETPAPGVVTLENELVTGRKGTRRRVRLSREVDGKAMTLKLAGSLPEGSDAVRYYRTVPNPTAYFTAAFAGMMSQHGITVKGHYLDGEAPDSTDTLVSLRSRPLAAILMDMNKYSNNFIAEQVLKTLGAEGETGAGTTAAGIEAVSTYLDGIGVPRGEYTLMNGSGLSREIVLRPSQLTAVLVDMAHDPVSGSEFHASLAIGGRDGTLWSRWRDDENVDRVRGKTGTLSGVHCLAGYVRAGTGDTYAFAYLVNDLDGASSQARKAHDALVEALLESQSTVVADRDP